MLDVFKLISRSSRIMVLMPIPRFHTLSPLPNAPAVYAMYGASGSPPAYVGIAGKLKQRLTQHLIRRDSSVTTGASVVSLNPDLLRKVVWWTDPRFEDRTHLEAAELIAFEVFNPTLRSRGGIRKEALGISEQEEFREEMKTRFEDDPSGVLVLRTLDDALEKIEQLEAKVTELENTLRQLSREK